MLLMSILEKIMPQNRKGFSDPPRPALQILDPCVPHPVLVSLVLFAMKQPEHNFIHMFNCSIIKLYFMVSG